MGMENVRNNRLFVSLRAILFLQNSEFSLTVAGESRQLRADGSPELNFRPELNYDDGPNCEHTLSGTRNFITYNFFFTD